MDMPIWSGVLPVALTAGEAITDEHSSAAVPEYVKQRLRG